MALVIADRVKETTTLTGTSNAINLGGAFTSFATFASKLTNDDTTYYCIEDTSGNFEIGLGTYNSSSNNIARTTVLKSSLSNNAVNWSSGSKTVFMTVPAEKLFIKDANGNNSSLVAKAPLASPALTGTPTAPTQSASDNSTKIATTAYVDNQVATENTIAEMDDVTITSVADNEVLAYDSSSSKFINQTAAEAGILTGNQTITLSGDVSGSGTTSIAVTIADDSHNHTIANVDDLQATLDAKSTASKTETLTNKSIVATQLTGTVANARLDQQLQDVAGLAVTNGNFIVGDGSNFVAENGSTARTSLGLGTSATTDTGISNGNVAVFTSGVADDDFLRVNGTNIEGRSASQVATDIGAVSAGFAIAMAVAL